MNLAAGTGSGTPGEGIAGHPPQHSTIHNPHSIVYPNFTTSSFAAFRDGRFAVGWVSPKRSSFTMS